MKAALLVEPRVLLMRDVPVPEIGEDEVLVRTRAFGVCGTDLTIYAGRRAVKLPHILGHETSGDVVEVGTAVKKLRPGDRVTIEPNFRCGVCDTCRRGLFNLCLAKQTLGLTMQGCFAEYFKVREEYAWKIPDSMTYLEAALVEPATVALHAVNFAEVRVGEKVLILGAGPIGLMVMQRVKLAGAEATVCDIARARCEMAARLGADHVGNGGDLKERTFDKVIDAAGMPATFLAALSLVKHGGTVVLVGFSGEPVTFDPTMIIRQEIKVKGVMACNGEFPDAIELISTKKMDVAQLVDCQLSFDDVAKGFKLMEERVALKPVVLL